MRFFPFSLPSLPKQRFWMGWMVMTVLGFLLSLWVIEIGERPDVASWQGSLGGLLIGGVQAVLLRGKLQRVRQWVWVNAIAWGVMTLGGVGAIGWVTPRTEVWVLRLFYGMFLGILSGLILGIAQWWVLHRQVPLARWWVVLSALCWGISLAVGWSFGGLLRGVTHLFLGDVIGLGITWVFVGGITGWGLTIFLQRHS